MKRDRTADFVPVKSAEDHVEMKTDKRARSEGAFNRAWVSALAVVLFCDTAIGQPERAAESHDRRPTSWRLAISSSTSPEGVMDALFTAIVTNCGAPGSQTRDSFYFNDGTLYQMKRAWTRLYPERITEADRLNGIQFKGIAALGAPLYRRITYYSHHAGSWEWTPWVEAGNVVPTPREIEYGPTLRPKSLSTLVETVRIERVNGVWQFKPDVASHFDIDAIASQKKSCRVATSDNPFDDASPH
jgi:hypothetical protein